MALALHHASIEPCFFGLDASLVAPTTIAPFDEWTCSTMAAQSTLRQSMDPLLAILGPWARLFRSKYKQTSKVTRLAATLALLITIISGAYGGRIWRIQDSRKKAQHQRLLRRNSGLRGKDGSRTIIVPYRSSTAEVKIYPTRPMTFDAHRRLFLNPPRAARLGDGQVPPPNTKPGLNIAFIHQFLSLLSIMVPHWNSKESGLLFSQGIFLLLRTYLSLVVTRLDGEIVRDLVAGNGRSFLWGIVKWCGVGGMFRSKRRAARTSTDFSRLCIIHKRCYQIPAEQSLHSFPHKTHPIHPRSLSERQS